MTCPHCGCDFTPKNNRQRYCGPPCYIAHNRAGMRERAKRNYKAVGELDPEFVADRERRIQELQRKYENAPAE